MEKEKIWIEKMPKVDLHCHLDGSLSAHTIELLAKMRGIPLVDGWRDKISVDDRCASLTEYLKCFELPLCCLHSEEAFFGAVKNLLCDASKEQVMYMEIRFAPMLSVTESLSGEEIVEAALEGLKSAKREYDIGGNLILCCMRNHGTKENEEVIRLAKKYYGRGVCAVDLAGDESAYPTDRFRELFEIVKRAGLPCTIHAGECGSADEVRTALQIGADRIGHGIAMRGKRELQQICKKKRIGVELCPSSNLQTKAVGNLRDYPIEEFLKEGLLVSVNTDNRTVSGTTLTEELWKIRKNFKISAEELTQYAVDTSFAEEDEKKTMRQRLSQYCEKTKR